MDQPRGQAPPLGDVAESWPVTDSEDLHRDDWVVALRADRITRPGDPDGEPFRRLVLEHPGAVVVLAVDERDRACCLLQYRHPAQRRFVELPAGLCDEPGEEPLAVAQRELQEEVGLAASSWAHLATTYSSPGLSTEQMHFYLARGLTDVGRDDFDLEHEEAEMSVVWVPLTELRAAVLDGRVADAPLVLAVLLADARGVGAPSARGE
ncbi:NUDIX domain-containing protein [Nocardioides coralli]|uniref:NUDIX domain-containing protein n=1 Tax=Nocardioides coralli TaxID=2872154 RepID=UPI001CA3FCAE|nr:NUDIX hydrolase [Nocardioides coralli]QZY30579.1 NUDIX hydrolase [Nocardioides coralli]